MAVAGQGLLRHPQGGLPTGFHGARAAVLRVADDGTTSCPNEGRRCAKVTAFYSMSGVDTARSLRLGWHLPDVLRLAVQERHDRRTARPYIVARDARTAIILLANGQYGPPSTPSATRRPAWGSSSPTATTTSTRSASSGAWTSAGTGEQGHLRRQLRGASYWYEGGSAYEKTGIYVCRDFDGFPGGLSGQLPPHPSRPGGNRSGKAHLACDGMNG